jgi:hypothetical protein
MKKCKFCEHDFTANRKKQMFCNAKCCGEYKQKPNRPTKEKLLEIKKTMSLREIAKLYNTSAVSIHNWLKE